uniref:Dynamin-type G domain-containing protein n=1 Tax=Rhizochromulina marina TaxID=1034831 RepID=A0A7S2W2F2_9STRA|mmetsp:Transcript_12241/g.35429  ORF Transcript_12241/g.35429 Transcript_12241/m.35429 type:complete len:428 (+) Transcript_12241:125-1408(+)|eukprot:CAMPEP_0118973686 /NCGR_PEP_ID=MMETSP1173-20130426/10731_1 /TAXON_ID=1034831 /ORGANISM="Rhizochromulina marina cf, Strain CCMP1243" /LENGTH=427 /DNA_ID=CAMNT_0006923377 /DNA_START=40 /DNA_END=1323 /DNA_ORIENTATION=-
MADFSADEARGHQAVIDGIKTIYRDVVRPIEVATKFESFHSNILTDSEFDAAPMVLLVGPYSVGKTSFIQYILGRNFPGQRVGPEPTTDRFMAVMYGESDKSIPGNALTVAPGSPFGGLKFYGNNFLTRFEGAIVNAPVLERLSLIDTPGVLSGEKQRLNRNYDFDQIVKWFAERVDMIILLFDPFKLDISDELASVIKILKGNEDKIRVVLNKADAIGVQQLMRVYGALMWSLGKVFDTPEVTRVYIGSFWEQPPRNPDTSPLLLAEMDDLLNDLRALPRSAAVRKVNELVKRIRLLRAHAYILHELRDMMPRFTGQEKKQRELLDPTKMSEVFRTVHRKHNLPPGDFPDIKKFIAVAGDLKFTEFPRVDGSRLRNGKLLEQLDLVVREDIPKILESMPGLAGSGSTFYDTGASQQSQEQYDTVYR